MDLVSVVVRGTDLVGVSRRGAVYIYDFMTHTWRKDRPL